MIDFTSHVPRWYQLKLILQQRILDRHWETHEPILSEPQLCLTYMVSRATVRQAIGEMEHEGWVYREQGKGTFVQSPEKRKDVVY